MYGYTSKRLIDDDIDIFVSLTGFDDAFAQTVHVYKRYRPKDIVFNSKFVDMIEFDSDTGGRTVYLDKIHKINESKSAG